MTKLSSEEIEDSKQSLLDEGFGSRSRAVLVHDQLIASQRELETLGQVNERNVDGAWRSMEDLKAECTRLREALEQYLEAQNGPQIRAAQRKAWKALGYNESPKDQAESGAA